MVTRQLCGMTDIAVRIVAVEIENLNPGIPKPVGDDGPVTVSRSAFETKKAGWTLADYFRKFIEGGLRLRPLEMLTVDCPEFVVTARPGRVTTRFRVTQIN